MRSARDTTFQFVVLASTLVLVLTLSGQETPQAGQRGRGRGGDQFAGQPRVNALVISGGCCHDYALQSKLLVD